ncbi:MAG: hypothetical protein AB7G62_02280 [Magnetospirillum sp.]
MTTSPSIRATALPPLPHSGNSGAVGNDQTDVPAGDEASRTTQDHIAVDTDEADILWQAKQDPDSWTQDEDQRLQRQLASLALSSAPTIAGREAVLRQMEALRHGLNEQGVALVTRKAAIALEINPLPLTSPSRAASLLRVF